MRTPTAKSLRIAHGDIWKYHEKGAWAVITTNTQTKRTGEAVMGRGIALQASQRFPDLALRYGAYLLDPDPQAPPPDLPWLVPEHRLVLFPTKIDWRDPSKLELIKENLAFFTQELWRAWVDAALDRPVNSGPYVAFPPLGCGNGGLDWTTQVRPLMEQYLGHSDRYVAVIPDGWE